MRRSRSHFMRVIAAALLLFGPTRIAIAQSPADFYKNRNVDEYIGYSTGGAYDFYARVIGRHMGAHIPGNPTLVPRNMEGAGSLRLANWLYRVAPQDGSVFATFGRGIAFDPLLIGKGDQFDAVKFNWLGSANNEVSVCVVWHTTGVTRFEEALTKTLVVGASGPSADSYQFPKIVNGVLGSKFKIITGYPGGNDIDLAMERGEVQGRCSWSWTSLQATRRSWLADKKINLLFQMGLSKHPDLPDIPLVIDLAKRDEDRAVLELVFARQVMAWPYLAPPGIPPDRADALRRAFVQTMNDADFLADAEKSRLEVRPVAGEDVEKLVRRVYGTPAAIAERAASLLK
jgi:tripartite-type tricarboxylate transporter receptor subunit TctC